MERPLPCLASVYITACFHFPAATARTTATKPKTMVKATSRAETAAAAAIIIVVTAVCFYIVILLVMVVKNNIYALIITDRSFQYK